MIRISEVAHKIESFLSDKGEDKFKIFIRINFYIDVYVCTNKKEDAQKYQDEFVNSLLHNDLRQDAEGDVFYNAHYDSLKIKFVIIAEEEAIDDPFYVNMFSDIEDTIDWGPRYRFDSFLQKRKDLIHTIREKMDYKGEVSDDEDSIIKYDETQDALSESIVKYNRSSIKSEERPKLSHPDRLRAGRWYGCHAV